MVTQNRIKSGFKSKFVAGVLLACGMLSIGSNSAKAVEWISLEGIRCHSNYRFPFRVYECVEGVERLFEVISTDQVQFLTTREGGNDWGEEITVRVKVAFPENNGSPQVFETGFSYSPPATVESCENAANYVRRRSNERVVFSATCECSEIKGNSSCTGAKIKVRKM